MIRPALVLLLLFTVLTGAAYPAAITGISQLLFPSQANGSLVKVGDGVVGSALIGQAFDDPKYFFGRASTTSPAPFNAAASTGSNWGPLNPALKDAVAARVAAIKAHDPANPAPVPADLVTASGSGLDPHISPAAAQYQVARVARVRGMEEGAVQALVAAQTEGRTLGLLGEARVNVLLLNLALDRAAGGTPLQGAPEGATVVP